LVPSIKGTSLSTGHFHPVQRVLLVNLLTRILKVHRRRCPFHRYGRQVGRPDYLTRPSSVHPAQAMIGHSLLVQRHANANAEVAFVEPNNAP
jgi:hypothetical protein